MIIELTVAEAHRLLKHFDCADVRTPETLPDHPVVRQSLQLVVDSSDYQIFGVCADTATEGYRTLKSYLEALDCPHSFIPMAVEGPAYIKFNGKTGGCYAESYDGRHRGVVVSCQSAFADGVNETYGHLPLDLFLSK